MPYEPKNKHLDTPRRARVQGAVEFLQAKGLDVKKEDVFEYSGVPRSSGYKLIEASSRTRHNQNLIETRGRKSKASGQQVAEADKILQEIELELEGKRLTWEQLATEVTAEIIGRTMHRIMKLAMDYEKCKACVTGWLAARPMDRRIRWAKYMLNKYPKPEDWHRVRFSDEVHFDWGPEGQLYIIRRPGTRYRQDCIQHKDPPKDKDVKRKHCWAAIGYNFKSPIYFYHTSTNDNGKLSHEAYIDQILEPIVKPWIQSGQDFVLEEDGDSGHGPANNNNIVREWKEKNGLEYYFNCASSPDLASIENCWLTPKQKLRSVAHWDDETTEELILEGWAGVTQKYINRIVNSMPERLQAVIDGHGALSGY